MAASGPSWGTWNLSLCCIYSLVMVQRAGATLGVAPRLQKVELRLQEVQCEGSAVAIGLEKVSFHSKPRERQCQRIFKLPPNPLISHASKVMLKILQARLQQYVNHELPDVQAGFRKGRGTRDQIVNIC